jgi:23S rRNA (guanosine2251-2'-O)-methyltransferase
MSGPDTTIHGLHAVAAALRNERVQVRELLLQHGRDDARVSEVLKFAQQRRIAVRRVPRKELDDRFAGARHQGVVAICDAIPHYDEDDLDDILDAVAGPPFLLVLDGVQDPHNLGACLRSADAAGVHAVVMPKDRASPLNATARKVASGAAESVPVVQVTNLARVLRAIKDRGIWLVGAAGETEQSIYELDLRGALAIVMGAEGQGMRRLTKEHCDFLAHIPMAGVVESLNVSVATGICLFEAVRQRGAGKPT